MNADKIAHLGFVQAIITRMGTNSFLLKGWSVTLVAAIFALSSRDTNIHFILLAYFPVVMFWLLDAFFLWQEKLYRKLYEEIADNKISSEKFTLDTNLLTNTVKAAPACFFSKTLLPFYGLIIVLVLCATRF